MTYEALYAWARRQLEAAGVEDFALDARYIFEHFFKICRINLLDFRGKKPPELETTQFLAAIKERAEGRPLQYILGEWEFFGQRFFVGEGVLIPRQDTETLVRCVLQLCLGIGNPRILDLCAGPGTVALSLAKFLNQAEITAVEISPVAIKFLEKNKEALGTENVQVIMADIFEDKVLGLPLFDLITSNPPYIAEEEFARLPVHVQYEPRIALCAGQNGLEFYHRIARISYKILREKGKICVEVGKGQAEEVVKIFCKNGLKNATVTKDLSGIERVVTAEKFEGA